MGNLITLMVCHALKPFAAQQHPLTFFEYHADTGSDSGVNYLSKSYPSWSTERGIPVSQEEIEDIFLNLTQKFGFQRDSMRNMVGASYLSANPMSLITFLPRLFISLISLCNSSTRGPPE